MLVEADPAPKENCPIGAGAAVDAGVADEMAPNVKPLAGAVDVVVVPPPKEIPPGAADDAELVKVEAPLNENPPPGGAAVDVA